MTVGLALTGCWLWAVHAGSWDLGRRSGVLSYDSAQYALAARELSDHGRLATTFALPLELSRHAAPPWPLAVLQPGLVVLEATLFKLVPSTFMLGGQKIARPDQREWLTLVVPLLCYLATGLALALATIRVLRVQAPDLSIERRVAAGTVVALAFLLDPESQHFAVGGFTELPFTLGLVLAIAALALNAAPRHPLVFGLLLGVTGSFRGNMLWIAPVLALAAAALAAPERRLRVLAWALAGYALIASPWWIYKWRAFGSPAWDLTRFVVWDGVGGRSWSSIYHLCESPALPSGFAAAGLLAAKIARNIPPLLLASLTGPRALWLGALAVFAALQGPRAPRVAAVAVLVVFALGVLSAAATIPWLRYVYPARVPLEAAGLLALWALLARMPATNATMARALAIGAAGLAIVWGVQATFRGNAEAREASTERSVPGAASLLAIGVLLAREVPPGEAVMSNLGPQLAWEVRRPVVHLALAPEDVDACRRKLDFKRIVLVYRDARRAGPWSNVVERPEEARHTPEWNITRARAWRTADGFTLVVLDLGPLAAPVAQLAR